MRMRCPEPAAAFWSEGLGHCRYVYSVRTVPYRQDATVLESRGYWFVCSKALCLHNGTGKKSHVTIVRRTIVLALPN